MSAKVLVLGGTGMLGHMALRVLSAESELSVRATHITNPADPFFFDVEKGLQKLELICSRMGSCDYVINCIGVTAANINPSQPPSLVKAININALFPHQLGLFCRSNGIRLIHISTDGVFSGRGQTYDESSECDCPDFYGKTKSLGEVLNNASVINIRCSIIGPSPYEKGGLWEWFCSQPSAAVISGYTNHIWKGVTTYQFAELCRKIITQNKFDKLRDTSPVFHFTPNQPVSKYELLCFFKSALKRDITIKPAEHAGGAVRRLLVSKFTVFGELYGQEHTMESSIKEMMDFIDTKHYSGVSTWE